MWWNPVCSLGLGPPPPDVLGQRHRGAALLSQLECGNHGLHYVWPHEVTYWATCTEEKQSLLKYVGQAQPVWHSGWVLACECGVCRGLGLSGLVASSVLGPKGQNQGFCLGCFYFWRFWRIHFEIHSGCWPNLLPLVVELKSPFLCCLSARDSLSPLHCLYPNHTAPSTFIQQR